MSVNDRVILLFFVRVLFSRNFVKIAEFTVPRDCTIYVCQFQDIQDGQIYRVDLNRGHRGFGFSIRGGQEFNNMPLFVLRIAEGGAADVDRRLRVSLGTEVFLDYA